MNVYTYSGLYFTQRIRRKNSNFLFCCVFFFLATLGVTFIAVQVYYYFYYSFVCFFFFFSLFLCFCVWPLFCRQLLCVHVRPKNVEMAADYTQCTIWRLTTNSSNIPRRKRNPNKNKRNFIFSHFCLVVIVFWALLALNKLLSSCGTFPILVTGPVLRPRL